MALFVNFVANSYTLFGGDGFIFRVVEEVRTCSRALARCMNSFAFSATSVILDGIL